MKAAADPVEASIESWRHQYPEALNASWELSKRVLFMADRLHHVMREVLSEWGLTVTEFDVLAALCRVEEPYRLKPNQLVRSLMVSSGGITNVAHRLVSRGLVERESDPDDARSTWLHLTPEGVAIARDAVAAVAVAHHDLFTTVPEEKLDAATTTLRDVFADAPALRRSWRVR